jgi:beta-lactamase class D
MNRLFSFVNITLIIVVLISIAFLQTPLVLTQPNPIPKPPITNNAPNNINFGRHFKELGVDGSISIYDSTRDRTYQYNPKRNTTAFLPASTFKILNSLIALETGVIANELSILTWDGISRALPEWNRDLNMREAIKGSAVWFYQVLARRIGFDRMQQWVARVDYGNRQIGTKEYIDRFWLEGDLRITPAQQIQFLRRLYRNELPFSARSIATVKDILILEQTPEYKLSGKTGWVGYQTQRNIPQIGWFVGYLEKGRDVYFFATNIDIRTPQDAKKRISLTRKCLKDLISSF